VSDPGLICSIDLDTGEALLPLSEFAPLVDRNVQLEAALVDALSLVDALANSLRVMLKLR